MKERRERERRAITIECPHFVFVYKRNVKRNEDGERTTTASTTTTKTTTKRKELHGGKKWRDNVIVRSALYITYPSP